MTPPITSREGGASAPLRLLDLFSGIGGFALGLERAGMQPISFCEIEEYCRAVLAKHWPGVPCTEDITKREFYEGEADVICGGFPCQDLSNAGLRAGLTGSRSGLWRELLRAIRMVRPIRAIVENVAALLGRGMGTVLGDLAEIGYDAEWHCIPASAAGAPHRRDRVWIIANPRSEQYEGRCAPIGGALAAELSGAGYLADASWNMLAEQKTGRSQRERIGARGQSSDGADTEDSYRRRPDGEDDRGGRNPKIGGLGQRRYWAKHWLVEPDVGRVAYGVPQRVDRLRGLGNAVVPQIPEMIGRAILQSMDAA